MASLIKKNKILLEVVPERLISKMCHTLSISRVTGSSKTKILLVRRDRVLPLGLTPQLMFISLTCLATLDNKAHNSKLIYKRWLVIMA